ncbi:MAG: hypothetical protein ACLRSE_02575 [Alistipes finegoldii]
MTFSESAVSFVVAENTGDQPRSASLKITYKDTDVECRLDAPADAGGQASSRSPTCAP